MLAQEVWFSHRENKYEIKKRLFSRKKKFSWTDKKEIWDWDYCTVGLARTLDNRLIVVVRSKTNKNSNYMGNKPVELRYMLGFEVTSVSKPKTELYTARKYKPDKKEGPWERNVFHLKGAASEDDYWIWDWAQEGGDINSSNICRLYQLISQEIMSPSKKSDNIFDVELESPPDKPIPIIYQPAVDSLKNFVREVHCAQSEIADGSIEFEVSIVFNNEELRKHAYGGIVNTIYERFRQFYHGRVLDVETLKFRVRKDVSDNKFIFENIYSDDHQLDHDSIHGDPPDAPERSIKYYFISHNNPVVFVNTSNHAMAEHDTNHRIWKWEYVPWMKNAPIKLGNKTRKEIEEAFK